MAHFKTNNLFASALRSNYPPELMKQRIVLSQLFETARVSRGKPATHHLGEGYTLTKGQVILLQQLHQTVYLCDQGGWFYWKIDDDLNLIRVPKEEESI